MSTLSAIVVTRHPSERAIELLRTVRPSSTSSSSRSTPGRRGRARALEELADTVALFEFTSSIERQWEWIASLATGGWILWLDDDELPSPALVASLRRPRRGDRRDALPLAANLDLAQRRRGAQRASLGSRPQPALYRADPALVWYPGLLHVPVKHIGPYRLVDEPLYHVDLVHNSEQSRRAKAALRAPTAGSQGCRTSLRTRPSTFRRIACNRPATVARARRRPGGDRAVPRERLRPDRGEAPDPPSEAWNRGGHRGCLPGCAPTPSSTTARSFSSGDRPGARGCRALGRGTRRESRVELVGSRRLPRVSTCSSPTAGTPRTGRSSPATASALRCPSACRRAEASSSPSTSSRLPIPAATRSASISSVSTSTGSAVSCASMSMCSASHRGGARRPRRPLDRRRRRSCSHRGRARSPAHAARTRSRLVECRHWLPGGRRPDGRDAGDPPLRLLLAATRRVGAARSHTKPPPSISSSSREPRGWPARPVARGSRARRLHACPRAAGRRDRGGRWRGVGVA